MDVSHGTITADTSTIMLHGAELQGNCSNNILVTIWCVVLLNVLLLSCIDALQSLGISMINSKNSIVRELITHFLTTESSVFADNSRYLMYKYDISVFAWYRSHYDVMNCIKNIQKLAI